MPENNFQDFVGDHPIPGASLTGEGSLPFEQPPEHVDAQKAIADIWERVSDKDYLPEFFRLLRNDVPIADIAQSLLFIGFAEGKWSTDLQMILIEPTLYMLMYLAERAGVEYVFSKEIPSLDKVVEGGIAKRDKNVLPVEEPKGLMNKGMIDG